MLRALDKLAKAGREAVQRELQKASDQGGPGLTEDQARKVLDFAETGRGGAEVLRSAEAILGSNPSAAVGIANLRTVLDLLEAAGVPRERIAIDLGLARGLDYYTGIVFETTVNGWEKFSVASGGRYDNLASLFTPRRLPGVGASIGLDRLVALMDEAGWLGSSATTAPVLVANFPGTDPAVPFKMAARLRAVGIGTEVFPDPIPIGKQMGYGSNARAQAGRDRRAGRASQAGLQPPQPRDPAGGQGACLVSTGRLGRECAADRQAAMVPPPERPTVGTRWIIGSKRRIIVWIVVNGSDWSARESGSPWRARRVRRMGTARRSRANRD